MSRRCVSIVIPTWNGMGTLPELVARIRGQRADAEVEVVAVDSGSTDGTRQYLSSRVDRLIELAPGEFDHGLTRNKGIERSRGELAVLLVQDALPADPHWLAALLRPFDDPRVAGAFARQLPRPDSSAITRHALARHQACSATPRVVCFEREEQFEALSPMEKLDACAFDDICSCVRRSAWQRHPFRQTEIAEDLEWAQQALRAGLALAYVPAAAVYHSHERSLSYELGRTLRVHRRLHQLLGVRTVPTPGKLAKAVASQLFAHARVLAGEPPPRAERARQLSRALGLAVVWPLGQYLGGRA